MARQEWYGTKPHASTRILRALKIIGNVLAVSVLAFLGIYWVARQIPKWDITADKPQVIAQSETSSQTDLNTTPHKVEPSQLPADQMAHLSQELDQAKIRALQCMNDGAKPVSGSQAEIGKIIEGLAANCSKPYLTLSRQLDGGSNRFDQANLGLLIALAYEANGCQYAGEDHARLICSPPRQAYARGMQVTSATGISRPPIGGDGWLQGALICPDLGAVNLMLRLYQYQITDALQDRVTGGASQLMRPSAASPNPKAWGCSLVPPGTFLLVKFIGPIPQVWAYPIGGAHAAGVTYPEMIQ